MSPYENLSPALKHTIEQLKQESVSETALSAMELRLKERLSREADVGTTECENELLTDNSFQTDSVYTRWMKGFRSAVSLLSPTQFLSFRSISWVGSTAAIATAFGFVFMLGSPSPAFAEVVQKLKQISDMTFESQMKSQGETFMQMKVYYRATGQLRVETQPLTENSQDGLSINVLDLNSGHGLIRFPGPKVAVPFQFDPQQSLDSAQDNPMYWYEKITQFQGEAETLQAKIENNRTLHGFVIKDSGVQITLWVDSETQLPVNMTLTTGNGQAHNLFEMEAQFDFNPIQNDTLFSLTPESDYQTGATD